MLKYSKALVLKTLRDALEVAVDPAKKAFRESPALAPYYGTAEDVKEIQDQIKALECRP